MKIGIPKEIKDQETRVALTPSDTATLIASGHEVLVERGAGSGCGFADRDYRDAGAALGGAAEAWGRELVIKVKEPTEAEYRYFAGQVVFSYLHLAGVPKALTDALLASRTTGIAYETVEDARGRFPLLAPMSAVAGSMAPLMGSYYLAKQNGGRGTLLGKVLGERHGKVAIIGDGVVGHHACDVAAGLGASVFVFGLVPERAADFRRPGADVHYVLSNAENLALHLRDADLLVGAVLRAGERAPHVVSEAMVASMPEGSVIVDVSIDQGGCVETSRPTSHSDPVFVKHGVVHYCVTNMPGAYPRTSTLALTAATLPYVQRLAAGGMRAVFDDPGFAKGVNTYRGHVTYRAIAEALGIAQSHRDLASITD